MRNCCVIARTVSKFAKQITQVEWAFNRMNCSFNGFVFN